MFYVFVFETKQDRDLILALINVTNDSSNSSTPCFKIIPDALGDEDDLDIESDRVSPESNG